MTSPDDLNNARELLIGNTGTIISLSGKDGTSVIDATDADVHFHRITAQGLWSNSLEQSPVLCRAGGLG